MQRKKHNLTPEFVRDVLSFDPATGVFTWLKRPFPSANITPGDRAGSLATDGRYRLGLGCTLHQLHRLAWFHFYGAWPDGEIDHVNGDPQDNRISNLRVASKAENRANQGRRPDNTSGFKGVTWNKSSAKWQAGIKVKGKSYHLGLFDDPAEAHAAYVAAAEKHYGKFARAA